MDINQLVRGVEFLQDKADGIFHIRCGQEVKLQNNLRKTRQRVAVYFGKREVFCAFDVHFQYHVPIVGMSVPFNEARQGFQLGMVRVKFACDARFEKMEFGMLRRQAVYRMVVHKDVRSGALRYIQIP